MTNMHETKTQLETASRTAHEGLDLLRADRGAREARVAEYTGIIAAIDEIAGRLDVLREGLGPLRSNIKASEEKLHDAGTIVGGLGSSNTRLTQAGRFYHRAGAHAGSGDTSMTASLNMEASCLDDVIAAVGSLRGAVTLPRFAANPEAFVVEASKCVTAGDELLAEYAAGVGLSMQAGGNTEASGQTS